MLLDDSSGALIEVTCGQPAPTVKAADSLDDFSNKIIEPDISLKGVTATGRTIDLHGVDIGTVVKVKGDIGSWKGEKQMHLERICTLCLYSIYVSHCNLETLTIIVSSQLSSAPATKKPPSAWAENIAFRKSILNNPWSVSEKVEKRVRRKAEGLDCERKARDERKKRKENAERDGKLNALQKRRQKALEESRRAEKERDEEARRAAEKAERERQQEAVRLAAEREKKERDKGRREQERRLRELEYERLMRAKEGEGG